MCNAICEDIVPWHVQVSMSRANFPAKDSNMLIAANATTLCVHTQVKLLFKKHATCMLPCLFQNKKFSHPKEKCCQPGGFYLYIFINFNHHGQSTAKNMLCDNIMLVVGIY